MLGFDNTFNPKFDISSCSAFGNLLHQIKVQNYVISREDVHHRFPYTAEQLSDFGRSASSYWCVTVPYRSKTAIVLDDALTETILSQLSDLNARIKERGAVLDLKFKVVTMRKENGELQVVNTRDVTADMMPIFIYDPVAAQAFIGPGSQGATVDPMWIQLTVEQMSRYVGVFVRDQDQTEGVLYFVNNVPTITSEGKEVVEKPYEALVSTLLSSKDETESLSTLFATALYLRGNKPSR